MNTVPKNLVLEVPAAGPAEATAYFTERFAYETDCWDVHTACGLDNPGFVLVDVRSREIYDKAHLPGAVNIPHWTITESRLAEYPADTLFVVYCSGPHCNGSTRGAIRFAQLGRPVKEMIGGTTGWLDEGFELEAR